MKSEGGSLLTLASFFALMSLFAIGGANSAVPEIHRFAVKVQQWLSDRQFSESFALAQLTPGPNVILVTLIGYHVAGILGAVVATLAMCGPTFVLAFFVGGASDRFRGSRDRIFGPDRPGSPNNPRRTCTRFVGTSFEARLKET